VSRKNIRLLVSSIVFLLFLGFQVYNQNYPQKNVLSVRDAPKQNVPSVYKVVKVVDGDTFSVSFNNSTLKVRVLGINTPETVDPRRKVECFGKEASDKAKGLLTSQTVRLESDPSQGDKDKYGRLLRYVFLPNNIDYGLEMIKSGFAYEYTYDTPYKYQKDYKSAQIEAERLRVGLWSEKLCGGKL